MGMRSDVGEAKEGERIAAKEIRMSSRFRLVAPLAVLAVVGSAFITPTVHAARRHRASVGFSTPTVVDNFRPGFEPDLGVDVSPKGGDKTYVSFPFGFSTTQSLIYRSDDHRKSFHMIEGNVDGKPGTCAGGGDSEIKIDPLTGAIYFVDLQGLTNFSASRSDDHGKTFETSCNSVNGTAVDRQWLGIDT
ncbi:MAG: hypothetical protein M3290_12895, partial [Actinomycetota bacterium]|nr:hypothetical protein [Actinomycetota bacterium]